MTDIIPRDLIRHLEWDPNREVPQHPRKGFSIENILKGKTFFGCSNGGTKYSNGVEAFREALKYVGPEGILATIPEITAIDGENFHNLRGTYYYTAHTEENVGIDKKGRFYSKNQPVLVIVNGGGLITPERIEKAYPNEEIFKSKAIRYKGKEFDELLDGKLPYGTSIPLHSFEEIKNGIPKLTHRFGIVMPYELAANTHSGEHTKKEFLENPLAIARAGGQENLENFFDTTRNNFHHLENIRPDMPTGRLILVANYGMDDDFNPKRWCRFLGVKPK